MHASRLPSSLTVCLNPQDYSLLKIQADKGCGARTYNFLQELIGIFYFHDGCKAKQPLIFEASKLPKPCSIYLYNRNTALFKRYSGDKHKGLMPVKRQTLLFRPLGSLTARGKFTVTRRAAVRRSAPQ